MKFQGAVLIGVLIFLFGSCDKNNPQTVADTSDRDITDKKPSGDGGDDTSFLGVGPEVIPDGSSEVGTSPLEDGSAARLKLYGEPQYFWGDIGDGINVPIVRITHAVSEKVVDIEVTFNPAFVDNTYGKNSIGWNPKRPHTFKDLYSSDHVAIALTNGDQEVVWKGKIDLLSQTNKVSSGYACLGPFGGDGKIEFGDGSAVLSFGSTLDDNINYYGYHLFEDSPATDSTYKPDPQYPHWQFYVSYHLTFDASIFGASGYGKVEMTSAHASPSKGKETVSVTEMNGPVPGTQDDPFRYFTPSVPVTPVDPNPNDSDSDTIPGVNDPGNGVG